MSERLVVDLSECDDYTEAYNLRCMIRSFATCPDDGIAAEIMDEYFERMRVLMEKNPRVAWAVDRYSMDVFMAVRDFND